MIKRLIGAAALASATLTGVLATPAFAHERDNRNGYYGRGYNENRDDRDGYRNQRRNDYRSSYYNDYRATDNDRDGYDRGRSYGSRRGGRRDR